MDTPSPSLARTVCVADACYFECYDDAQAHADEINDRAEHTGFTARVTTLLSDVHRVAFYDGNGSLAGFLARID